MSVLLGNGNGTFQAAQNFTTGSRPHSVAVADVNGDGKADLLAADFKGSSVSVLLGNGNGTFQAAQNVTTGMYPKSVAVTDINGDGRPDLIVPVLYNQLNVLLSNGDGTFQTSQSFSTGLGPNFVAVADLNGDGRPDLVSANGYGNSVSVLLAEATFKGPVYNIDHTDPALVSISRTTPSAALTDATSVVYTVTFSEPITGVDPTDFQVVKTGTVGTTLTQVTPVSGSVYTVSVSGITGSGSLGLNLVDNGSILDLAGNPLVQSNAIAMFGSSVNFRAGGNPKSVAVADVNGDGKPDLIVANYGSNTVSVLLGNGNGTFQGAHNFSTGTQPISVAVADVNGDGKPDILVSNDLSYTVSVLLGNGDGTSRSHRISPPVLHRSRSPWR